MRPPVQITEPSGLPVTLQEVKAFLRVDHSDEDSTLGTLLAAAVLHFDGKDGLLGRCLLPRQFRQDLCLFPACGEIELPFPDCREASIEYLDVSRTRVSLAPEAFELVEDACGTEIKRAWGAMWPSTGYAPDAVHVTFTAGYEDAASVPEPIKTAILFRCAELYQQRVDSSKSIIDMLIGPYRYQRLG